MWKKILPERSYYFAYESGKKTFHEKWNDRKILKLSFTQVQFVFFGHLA